MRFGIGLELGSEKKGFRTASRRLKTLQEAARRNLAQDGPKWLPISAGYQLVPAGPSWYQLGTSWYQLVPAGTMAMACARSAATVPLGIVAGPSDLARQLLSSMCDGGIVSRCDR